MLLHCTEMVDILSDRLNMVQFYANIDANLTSNTQVLIFSYRTTSGQQPLRESPLHASIVGSVVEFSPATRETGVRFPDNANFSSFFLLKNH